MYQALCRVTPLRGKAFSVAVGLSQYIHLNSHQDSAPPGKRSDIGLEAKYGL